MVNLNLASGRWTLIEWLIIRYGGVEWEFGRRFRRIIRALGYKYPDYHVHYGAC